VLLMVLGVLGWRKKRKAQTACIGRSLTTAIAFTTTIVCGPGSVPLAARADTLSYSATLVTDVVFGTNNIVTIQTGNAVTLYQNGVLDPVGMTYELSSADATAAGQSFAAQLIADPTTSTGVAPIYINPVTGALEYNVPIGQPIPAYVLNAISNSADSYVLGLDEGALTTFTSFVLVDPDYSFSYGFTTTPMSGPYAGDQLDLLDNFEFYQAETPIPAALPLFAAGLGVIGLFGLRRKRKAQAAV
jgi:hypothetical protein